MKTLLLAILIFTTASIFAQTNFRFADSTAQWNVRSGILMINYEGTLIFKANGDTVIAGKQYQKVLCPEDFYYREFHGNVPVRRDSAGRVYRRTSWDTTDVLIYDFSKNVGDTIMIYRNDQSYRNDTFYLVVETVDTVYLPYARKRMYFKNFTGVWVDGIGDLNNYFLSPVKSWYLSDAQEFNTLCFFEKEQLVYHDVNFDTCVVGYVTGIDETKRFQIKVFTNPSTNNAITIQSDASFPTEPKFQLFDITGRMILQRPLFDKVSHVELDGVSKGLFLYAIASNGQKISSGKLAVQ